jgi:hypothetical protein
LDGVLVNLEKEYYRITGVNLSEADEYYNYNTDAVWKIPKQYPSFWSSLPKTEYCNDLMEFINVIASVKNVYILSSYVENYENCTTEKRRWVRNNLMIPQENVHIVKRSEKKLFAYNSIDDCPNVLIDDYKKNIDEWTEHGGLGILHSDINNTIILLNESFKKTIQHNIRKKYIKDKHNEQQKT